MIYYSQSMLIKFFNNFAGKNELTFEESQVFYEMISKFIIIDWKNNPCYTTLKENCTFLKFSPFIQNPYVRQKHRFLFNFFFPGQGVKLAELFVNCFRK